MSRVTPPSSPRGEARSGSTPTTATPTAVTTTTVGGSGIVLALLYPLAASVASAFPNVFGLLLTPPGLQLVCWAVFAIACGVLAFGLPGQTGVVGPSVVGRTALFVFGVHRLVLDLSSLLTPLPTMSGALVPAAPGGAAFLGGYVSLGVSLLGSLAGLVAAVAVVRAGVLHGVARWMLVPAAAVDLLGLGLLLVPVQEVLVFAFATNALWYLLLVSTGVAYAMHGRGPALRALGRRLDAWW